jgi:hypothetical protein
MIISIYLIISIVLIVLFILFLILGIIFSIVALIVISVIFGALALFLSLFYFFEIAPVTNNSVSNPVKYGDLVLLQSSSLNLFASPCGNLNDPSGDLPVSLAGPVQLQIVSTSGIATGTQVNFGDIINLLYKGQKLSFKPDPNNASRQILVVDVTGTSTTAGEWTILNNSKTGSGVEYLNTFNLVNSNFFMGACISESSCIDYSGANCGNIIINSSTLNKGTTWEFNNISQA